ncbi:hypothetical protein DPMN_012816 [Dreissena polymorpha]|uniref:Myb/SANT-like DNA-binding domain-containing protein n=1 Tax=Dreissena polymorpha TaxID=45954 RepID=A0A9D4N6J6_DREPO|nr:hypothetical protein DPMN_012816 [Dreissena polymorpha]
MIVTLQLGEKRKKEIELDKNRNGGVSSCLHRAACADKRKFFITLTGKDKNLAWGKITEQINALGAEERTVEEVRKKISDTKTKLRKKERQRRLSMKQTGGGPSITQEQWEEKMIEVIGEEWIVGFGGVDTFAVKRTQQPMIEEHYGQSSSTMCEKPTVALEPQVESKHENQKAEDK